MVNNNLMTDIQLMSYCQTANASTPANAQSAESLGYLLDEQGRELPITEAMIQQACREIEAQHLDIAQLRQ